MKKALLLSLAITVIAACSQNNDSIAEHEQWQQNRIERLKSENGWLNLAGLLWLEEGTNTFGSDSCNSIIFPETFPAKGGSIIIDSSAIQLIADESIEILIDGEAKKEAMLRHDQQKDKTMMEHGQFKWFIIKRGDRFAIRLRDLQHPRIEELDHIPSYKFDPRMVIHTELIRYDSVRTIEVPTAIPGFTEKYQVPGELKFRIKGKEQTLLPFKSGDGYFIILGDGTNGEDTYGAGRFMYAKEYDEKVVVLDFNKAYNPPCAFSPYATCPLPPIENILDIDIKAGEKGVHLH